MGEGSRRARLSSLLAAAVATARVAVTSHTRQRSQEEAEPDAILNGVRAAINGKTEAEILAEVEAKAGAYFKLVGNCAQSSFMALRDVFGLPDGRITRALTGFPGLGCRGETCGTVSGSMMAVGLVYGSDNFEGGPGMLPAVRASAQIGEGVTAEVGSTQCGDILEAATGRQYDFTRREDFAAYMESDAPMTCARALIAATRTAAKLLIEAAA